MDYKKAPYSKIPQTVISLCDFRTDGMCICTGNCRNRSYTGAGRTRTEYILGMLCWGQAH